MPDPWSAEVTPFVDRCLFGDARERLAELPAGSVHCCVTSPPFYGLRDYGHASQIGLESTPAEYIAQMVGVMAEVRRVLRDDGSLWLEVGDSYSGSANSGSAHGLKPKDLIGIPWRLALALQADGWYLRADIIWHRNNPMPESVTDRPTKAHSYVFLLTKRARYFYDADAVREGYATDGVNGGMLSRGRIGPQGWQSGTPKNPAGRNARSVWTINTRPFSGAHFAVMPEALPERCIKAGTSERGVCGDCGAPWERVVEKERAKDPNRHTGRAAVGCSDRQDADQPRMIVTARTTGWAPTCSCDAGDPQPALCLDPFFGSGTTGKVARDLGRSYVGVELNPEYAEVQRLRFGGRGYAQRKALEDAGQLGLFADA